MISLFLLRLVTFAALVSDPEISADHPKDVVSVPVVVPEVRDLHLDQTDEVYRLDIFHHHKVIRESVLVSDPEISADHPKDVVHVPVVVPEVRDLHLDQTTPVPLVAPDVSVYMDLALYTLDVEDPLRVVVEEVEEVRDLHLDRSTAFDQSR